MGRVIQFCLLLLCAFSCMITISSLQTHSNLWAKEMLGTPNKVNFVNKNEFLLASNRGLISKIDKNGNIQWKKNLIYESEFELDSFGLCKLFI